MNDIKNTAVCDKKVPLVLKNASIINVFTREIEQGDIAICEDVILGIGNYVGEKEIDCTGLYVSPGFMDAHVHIESSMVTPENFSNLVIGCGTTTVIADPHEIANILGIKGIEFMINNSKKSAVDIFFMLPSCVPAVSFEDNGACLNAEELKKLSKNKKVLGLGEVMDVQAVLNAEPSMTEKLSLFRDKNIDGHCPNLNKENLNAYIAAGIKTDHECSTYEEALEKVRRGMYVMLREGSAARNIRAVIKAVREENFNRFVFCTDDRHIEDLVEEGSINHCLKIAIKEGLDPIMAIAMATINVANCYGLKKRGAIAPGYKADLVVLKNLSDIDIVKVIKDGKETNAKLKASRITSKSSINMSKVEEENFKIKCKTSTINLIKLVPNSLETAKEERKVTGDKAGNVYKVEGRDILKIGVFERHKNTGKYSLGFIEGLGLKNAALAQTIAHDSHNLLVVGDNDEDMKIAVNSLIDLGGGIVFVSKGEVKGALSLPIGGILSPSDPEKVLESIRNLNSLARDYGVKKEYDAFLTLGFIALPVIPEIKITARGLFDYNKFDFIDLFCDT